MPYYRNCNFWIHYSITKWCQQLLDEFSAPCHHAGIAAFVSGDGTRGLSLRNRACMRTVILYGKYFNSRNIHGLLKYKE